MVGSNLNVVGSRFKTPNFFYFKTLGHSNSSTHDSGADNSSNPVVPNLNLANITGKFGLVITRLEKSSGS